MIKPGTIILTRIQGFVGWLVWLMQAINGDFSKWTHVMVMLDDGTVFEAQPGGARISPWEKYIGRETAVVPWEMDDETRQKIVAHARTMKGTGYNWDTYFYLAAVRLHLPLATKIFYRRLQGTDKLICSQAADYLYQLYGQHLFNDGRKPFDLTPGDFEELL